MNRGRTKFNVSKDVSTRTFEGVTYDSAMEMKFYRDYVKPMLENGELASCERQVPFVLQESFLYKGKKIREITYVADFVLEYADGRVIVVDVKGMADSVALLKRKLFWFRFPDEEYVWMCYSTKDGGWVTYEQVAERRRNDKKEKKRKGEKDE